MAAKSFLKSCGWVALSAGVALSVLPAVSFAQQQPYGGGEHGGGGGRPGGGAGGGGRPGGAPQGGGAQVARPLPAPAPGGNVGRPQQPPQGGGQGQRPGGNPGFGGNNRPGFEGNRPGIGGNNRPGGENRPGIDGNNRPGFDGNRPGGGNNRPGFGGNNRPGFNGNHNNGRPGGSWNTGWRNDHRYNWQSYRNNHRDIFRLGRYYAPYNGWSYRRLSVGFMLDSMFYGSNYYISDPAYYSLPPAYPPFQWIRYYNDALLVNTYTGQVQDVIYDFFF